MRVCSSGVLMHVRGLWKPTYSFVLQVVLDGNKEAKTSHFTVGTIKVRTPKCYMTTQM